MLNDKVAIVTGSTSGIGLGIARSLAAEGCKVVLNSRKSTPENDRLCAELADEFSLTANELGFLPDRRHALQNLTDRVQLDAMRGVVTTLIQTEKYGTPLAMSLRVLSAEFRNERMMKAEEKAARLPATMTVPLILFILPTLFIVLLGPAACKVAD